MRIFRGHYVFKNGKFYPQGDMDLINKKLKHMKMLVGSTETGRGEFYFDPSEFTFWHYCQYQDYRAELFPVTKEFIEVNFPMLDCSKLVDLP